MFQVEPVGVPTTSMCAAVQMHRIESLFPRLIHDIIEQMVSNPLSTVGLCRDQVINIQNFSPM